MGKFALLIGISESSEEDLPKLPSAIEDIKAMQAVMQDPKLGNFDSVKVLPNPTRQEMEEEIETLFANRKKEDLVLFYFSGHGITDEKGRLYLVTPQTRKERGNLIKATAVSATVLHDNMGNSRSKHQVLILDSCFSGAIAEGLTGKSAGSKVDIQRELGGEGRAILTSSNAVQKSFYMQGYDLSIYTHYLIDGIQTGAANQDGDDYISVDELHEYVKKKLEQETPLMSPQFFPVKEGYKIRLVRSPQDDPKVRYPKETEHRSESGPSLKTCIKCKGSGEQQKVAYYTSMGTRIYTNELESCSTCGGIGQVPSSMRNRFLWQLVDCWSCGRGGIAYNSMHTHCTSCGKNLFPQKG